MLRMERILIAWSMLGNAVVSAIVTVGKQRFLVSTNVPSPGEWDETTMAIASLKSTECMIYLHENGCPWNRIASETAAVSGSLERLKYIHENGGPWSLKTCVNAAMSSIECLKYVHEQGTNMTV